MICKLLLLLDHEPHAEHPANIVRKHPKVGTSQVALKVSRVEMIRQIEHLQPKSEAVVLPLAGNSHALQRLHVEGKECGEVNCLVAWANKVSLRVHDGKREAVANVQHRSNRNAIFHTEVTPEQKAIRSVPGQLRSFVGLND